MPERHQITYSPRALADLVAIYEYIAADNPVAAARWMGRLCDEVESLALFPNRCPLIPEHMELERAYRHLVFGAYRIVFRLDGRFVRVVRVVHGARRVEGLEGPGA